MNRFLFSRHQWALNERPGSFSFPRCFSFLAAFLYTKKKWFLFNNTTACNTYDSIVTSSRRSIALAVPISSHQSNCIVSLSLQRLPSSASPSSLSKYSQEIIWNKFATETSRPPQSRHGHLIDRSWKEVRGHRWMTFQLGSTQRFWGKGTNLIMHANGWCIYSGNVARSEDAYRCQVCEEGQVLREIDIWANPSGKPTSLESEFSSETPPWLNSASLTTLN